MAHLNALDLLSPEPYPIARVGHVIAPTLRQVAALGYDTYNAYLSLLSLRRDQLANSSGLPLTAGDSPFVLMTANPELCALLSAAFSFFMTEEVVFSEQHGIFLCMDAGAPVGTIEASNYEDVCCCIL